MKPVNSHALWPPVVATALMLLLSAYDGGSAAIAPGAAEPAPPVAPALPDSGSAAAGLRHTVFLAGGGSVWTPGDGSTRNRSTPVPVFDDVRLPQ